MKRWALGAGREASHAQAVAETADSGAVRCGRGSRSSSPNRAAAVAGGGAVGKLEGKECTASADPHESAPEMER